MSKVKTKLRNAIEKTEKKNQSSLQHINMSVKQIEKDYGVSLDPIDKFGGLKTVGSTTGLSATELEVLLTTSKFNSTVLSKASDYLLTEVSHLEIQKELKEDDQVSLSQQTA